MKKASFVVLVLIIVCFLLGILHLLHIFDFNISPFIVEIALLGLMLALLGANDSGLGKCKKVLGLVALLCAVIGIFFLFFETRKIWIPLYQLLVALLWVSSLFCIIFSKCFLNLERMAFRNDKTNQSIMKNKLFSYPEVARMGLGGLFLGLPWILFLFLRSLNCNGDSQT